MNALSTHKPIAGLRSALILGALLLASPAAAADYYVSNGGDDADDGLSPASAWATLGHAAEEVAAGDTVHVADGGYQGFDLRSSGTAGSPITFVAEGSNVAITADNGTTPDGINIENASYVVIDGFILSGRTRAGLRVAVSDFVTVRNCLAGYNGTWGIFSGFADDILIENNETHHSAAEHGIYVSNSGDRPVIRGNLVHDNHGNGIHMNGDRSQGGDGTISEALVEDNVIYGNGIGGGSAINMDGVTDSVVRNNLLYDNHASGISLYRIDGAAGSTGNLVINNTILNASDGRWCVNINTGSTHNRVLNNILYNEHAFRGAISIDTSSRTGFVADYNSAMDRFSLNQGNTVIDLAAWQAAGYGAQSFLATPAEHFLGPASDFHLLNNSPAIDAGTATDGPARDLDRNPRPVGGGVDIGAYEAQLLDCDDGNIDAGEECGEPTLPACADPCTSCLQCVCALDDPVCGDAFICGSEQCEQNADCTGSQACIGCRCVNPPVCESAIETRKPKLKLRTNAFIMRLRGEAVIPKPWSGVDPPLSGIRVVVDSPQGEGGVDITIPGAAAWKTGGGGTVWKYADPEGSVGGVTRVVIKDRSNAQAGLLRWTIKAKGGAATLPDVGTVRSAVVVGNPSECASTDWNPPAGEQPRCKGDETRLSCR